LREMLLLVKSDLLPTCPVYCIIPRPCLFNLCFLSSS
jgi:hypothetical protein